MRNMRKFGRDLTNIPQGQPQKATFSVDLKPAPKISPQFNEDAICDYTRDIIEFLFRSESKGEKMEVEGPAGSEVTDKMRQILIDWLVDVHQSFQLREETLHLAVLYLDQYQAKRAVSKDSYQLLGIACLWIASKYEEIYPPRLKKYVEVTAYTYSGMQIKEMEGQILKALNFNLTKITPLALLSANQLPIPSRNQALIKFMLELSLLNGKIQQKYCGKMLIAASIRLSDAICGGIQNCSTLCQNLVESDVQNCYKQLCLLLKIENRYKLTAVRRKYAKEGYFNVGKIRLEI